MSEEKFEIIIFGATSFVGEILCQYMVAEYGVGEDVSWAVAGRSVGKLDTLKKTLGPSAKNLDIIVADAASEHSLREMADRADVIVSTVGPYALYGELLVKVCAETGTDYCDLTGEVQWSRLMGERYGDVAKKSGARIMHSCGFDSIPSDLGVHFLQEKAREKFGVPCIHVKMGVKALKGGMSGGTVASLLNVLKEAKDKPELRQELADPYSLCGREHGFTLPQPNVTFATYDRDFDAWVAPFIMAGINTRVVHQSNALSGKSYGEYFTYGEAMFMAGRMQATGASLAMGAFMGLASVGPARALLEKFALPKPGEGPTPEQQFKGFFDLRFRGETAGGDVMEVKVTGDRDPGYGSTAKMLSQAAICLAQDKDKTGSEAGFWTPATALGSVLRDRLIKFAGLTFEVL